MTIDILLYALVAAGLIFWLRSILGTRHGDERTRPNPFASQDAESQPQAAPVKDDTGFALMENKAEKELPRHFHITEAAKTGLEDIARADRHFDVFHFLQGAEGAFVMIVEAFAKGDRDALGGLLSEPVYKAFEGVIQGHEDKGETVDTEIHAVRKMDIIDAKLKHREAYITVQFIADETCVIKDKDGEIISGNPERVTEMNDIWVFSRDIKSKDPAWLLVETRDGVKEDEQKTPIPDAS